MLNRKKISATEAPASEGTGCDANASNPESAKQEILQLKARIAELERQVGTDTLTPLFNRRHFMQLLERWCARAQRYGGKAGLLYIDVDNMKEVNDTYGHETGDALLVAIAKGLLVAVRKSDIVARLGGDEFVVLLENIDPDNLPEKIAAIKKRIGKISISAGDTKLQPSVSAGAVPIRAGDKPEALLRAADKAMYADKKAAQRSDK
jgi:diguanylate cyclase (GGDEF)-like protein